MEDTQRTKNDTATESKREAADETLSKSRDKNDALTQERRFKADETTNKSRERNDETTAERREEKDANSPKGALAVFLLVLTILLMAAYFIFL